MQSDVKTQLSLLGYTPSEADDTAICSAIERAGQYIKDNTNRKKVPAGLSNVWVRMAAGLMLRDLYATGRLDQSGLDAAVKEVSEGDTKVVYAQEGAQSPQARLDKLLCSLINPPEELLAAYRRVRW